MGNSGQSSRARRAVLKFFLKSIIEQLGSPPSASKPPTKQLIKLCYLWESTWIAVGSVMMRGGEEWLYRTIHGHRWQEHSRDGQWEHCRDAPVLWAAGEIQSPSLC